MTPGLDIALAEDPAAIRACWPVMAQLRTQLDEAGFLERVQRQRLSGYRLAAGRLGDRLVVVAGFVLGEKLAWGRHLYVDDLVTDAGARSLGAGCAMLDWLKRHALDAGCETLHLDSGLERVDAHRFYAREGLAQASAHFAVALRATAATDSTAAASRASARVVTARTIAPAAKGPPRRGESQGSDRLDPASFEHDEPGEGQFEEDYDPSHEGGLDPDFH